ncbi:hypothetical protein ABZW18_03125 [Streptomyces sp. NPDC004647]|uniref:helix-turn-helix domain-containing protein n=1 Tax=Streptomyces sp. NPDC004647 TaxID=3154671 RepID=UPI00339EC177
MSLSGERLSGCGPPRIEEETDRLDRAPYEHLGEAGVARLTELTGGWTMTALSAGAFPEGLIGKG